MRVRINSLALEGTSRRIKFEPGLNIVTGPIASGKTTLLRLARALLGTPLDNLPPEAREAVTAISGELVLGSSVYSVLRSAVTTRTARVDIAGEAEAFRLPVSQVDRESETTYVRWLLDRLGLPRLEVPSAPTKPESEPTPISLNDYLLYCTLPQDEIGFSVFGHSDPFRNIKRKYVFEIVYGLYSVQTAQLQEKLRDIQAQLRQLHSQHELFARFLGDTALANRAEIERDLERARSEVANIEADVLETARRARESPDIESLQNRVLELQTKIQRLRADSEAEEHSIQDLEGLASQLESQLGKITRSIVAQKHLINIEFVVCPRCGAKVEQPRGDDAHCYLCLQLPQPQLSRQALIDEQARVEAQLAETRELLATRQERLQGLNKKLGLIHAEEEDAKRELDYLTQTFVSSEASRISSLAGRRAEAKARVGQLRDYLSVYQKLDEAQQLAAQLAEQKSEIEASIVAATGREAEIQQRINHLTDHFNDILDRFHPPEFGEEKRSAIDRRTYLPSYRGRRFDDLSSPGLGTLVNVAYALAHQQTAIELGLKLPNILFIDGLSDHLGEEGLDPERV
ncbi:MAG: hypothetical protein GTO24_19550 [candidate division Zixibacteria bacterium]|nr:hypothetical protein [candidate division Zixibacteria bacterium]